MVGQSDQFGSQDWINKSSPDDLITYGKAVLQKIATMDQSTQRRFADQVRNDPQVNSLLEQVTTA